MTIAAAVLTALVALLHVYILYLEMFLWTKPAGLRTFGMSLEKAEETKVFGANQGLYNGFLAAGLLWSLVHPDALFAYELKVFFLGCVIVAALYGAWSASRKILFTQGLPGLVAMIAVLVAGVQG
ncbi:putative membrane protein [Ensifer adhaerens]|nr:putative membrane protein [Ensifer adhaerens]